MTRLQHPRVQVHVQVKVEVQVKAHAGDFSYPSAFDLETDPEVGSSVNPHRCTGLAKETPRRRCRSVKLHLRGRLRGANAPRVDVSPEVVLTPDRHARDAAEKRDLPDMGQGVCEWSLKQRLCRRSELPA